ncbi:phospholipase/carboxylesterase [Pseudomonas agarici]|nr:phospholipase/carboxylesterase [Pseudomonas agarici]
MGLDRTRLIWHHWLLRCRTIWRCYSFADLCSSAHRALPGIFTNDGPSFNQEQAEASRQLLARFIKGQPQLPTVIAGFSQGAIMSSSLGLTEPELVKGFALLSGRMLREIGPLIAEPEKLKAVSAFIAHGHSDTVLPVSWANEADAWLERIGVAHQTHYYAMGHEIIAEELADFSAWLTKTLSLSN